jgi:hypothetical protein
MVRGSSARTPSCIQEHPPGQNATVASAIGPPVLERAIQDGVAEHDRRGGLAVRYLNGEGGGPDGSAHGAASGVNLVTEPSAANEGAESCMA